MKKSILFGFVLLGLIVSMTLGGCKCKRTLDDKEFQGEEMISAPAGFDFTTPLTATMVKTTGATTALTDTAVAGQTLRFEVKEKVRFNAVFTHKVSWVLTIKGRISGALRTFSGTSQVIDASNATWDGRSENYAFFAQGEVCDVNLTFLNGDKTGKVLVKLRNADTAPYKYDVYPYYNVKYCALIDDFDRESNYLKTRTNYSDVNDGPNKAKFIISNGNTLNDLFSMYMKGTDGNGNGYLGGFSNQDLLELHSATVGGISDSLSDDPNDVYINAYIYGYGRPNTALMLLLFESDDDVPPYKGAEDDNYQYIQEITWTGWKLVSIKYSSFKAAGNPTAGGSGNKIKEPKKLSGLGMELQCYPTPGLEVEANVDFVTITTGGPFVQ